jgi:zinc finger SWIM domain-containing protein 3
MADMNDESSEYHAIIIKTFASEDDGYQFYNRYALEKQFSVQRSYVEWDGANKEIVLRKLVCSREGCREEKHMKRKREDRKRSYGISPVMGVKSSWSLEESRKHGGGS